MARLGLNSCSGEPAARGKEADEKRAKENKSLNSCSGEPAARGDDEQAAVLAIAESQFLFW